MRDKRKNGGAAKVLADLVVPPIEIHVKTATRNGGPLGHELHEAFVNGGGRPEIAAKLRALADFIVHTEGGVEVDDGSIFVLLRYRSPRRVAP